jgi:hypothetical protein
MADTVKIETALALVVEAAENYIEAGFSPVKAIGKAMKGVGWNTLDLPKGEAKSYFDEGDNIGIRMGKTAGGIYATVDIDSDEAKTFSHYLPTTSMVHGRKESTDSHLTYRILDEEPLATMRFKGVDGESHIDLLGENSGVIVYPSIHPSGDEYLKSTSLEPRAVKAGELVSSVKKMYLATLALAHYPGTGSRQDFALGFSGLMVKGGYCADEAREIIIDVAKAAGDEEWQKRTNCLDSTAKKHDKGDQIAGYSLLVDIVGEPVAKKMSTALPKSVDGDESIKAKKKAIVKELNKTHAICMVGGKAAVLNEFLDPAFGHSTISFSGRMDFKLRYFNKRLRVSPPGKPVEYETYGDIWLAHRDRRQYDGIVFDPQSTPENHYNLFHGFAVEPVAGECGLFLSHLRDIICRGNDEHYDYLIRWMAHLVAIVIRGKQGTGKTTVVTYLGALLGQHYLTVTGMKQITGQFNGHMADKILVCANEAVWAGDKAGEGILKALITDPTTPVEFKFKDLVNVRNYKRLIITTNETWAAPIGVDDRRYVVLDASDARKEDKAYFSSLNAQMEQGGTEALMEYLSSLDIDGFQVRNAPYTPSAFDIKLMSSDRIYSFMYELMSGQMLPDYELEWQDRVLQSIFYKAYRQWCTDNKVSYPHGQKAFTTELKRVFPGPLVFKSSKHNKDGQRPREYRFPMLEQARDQFQKAMKSGPEIWEVDEE